MIRDDDDVPATISWRAFSFCVVFWLASTAMILVTIQAVSSWPSIEISPARIEQGLVQTIGCGESLPHGLEICVTGELDGNATIVTPLGEVALSSGPIETSIAGDFYETTATIEYCPENVSDGHLTISYRFRT